MWEETNVHIYVQYQLRIECTEFTDDYSLPNDEKHFHCERKSWSWEKENSKWKCSEIAEHNVGNENCL